MEKSFKNKDRHQRPGKDVVELDVSLKNKRKVCIQVLT